MTIADKYTKKNPVKATLLDTLAEQLKDVCRKLAAHEEKHAEAFAAYSELKDTRDGIEDQMKTEARKIVAPGEAKSILESALVNVSVVGKQPTISYDFQRAQIAWPSSVLKKCVVETLDAKLVTNAISLGLIKPEVAGQAEVRKENTPAVTFRYNVGVK